MRNKKGVELAFKIITKPIYAKIGAYLHKRIRVYCAKRVMDIQDFIAEASKEKLDREEARK